MSAAVNDATDNACCSTCGYSLRGLHDERCPECGTVFDLAALHAHRIRDQRDPLESRKLVFGICVGITILAGLFTRVSLGSVAAVFLGPVLWGRMPPRINMWLALIAAIISVTSIVLFAVKPSPARSALAFGGCLLWIGSGIFGLLLYNAF